MLKISKLADYATVLLAHLARTPSALHTTQQISERTAIPAPTVSKLVKLLTREGILISQRGIKGGYSFAKPPESISMAEVIQTVEGGIALTECSHEDSLCAFEGHCHIQHKWQALHRAFHDVLDGVSVADMASPLKPLSITVSHEPHTEEHCS